ncbi:hypothetical protein BTE77_11580, partial [Ensifer adhaerens]
MTREEAENRFPLIISEETPHAGLGTYLRDALEPDARFGNPRTVEAARSPRHHLVCRRHSRSRAVSGCGIQGRLCGD